MPVDVYFSKCFLNNEFLTIFSQLIAFNNKKKETGSTARAQQQAVDQVKANINWLKDNEQEIEEWLKKFLKGRNLL